MEIIKSMLWNLLCAFSELIRAKALHKLQRAVEIRTWQYSPRIHRLLLLEEGEKERKPAWVYILVARTWGSFSSCLLPWDMVQNPPGPVLLLRQRSFLQEYRSCLFIHRTKGVLRKGRRIRILDRAIVLPWCSFLHFHSCLTRPPKMFLFIGQ